MFTIHYRVGDLPVAVASEVDGVKPVLEGLFPVVPAAPTAAVIRIAAEAEGFSLSGLGEPYRSDRWDRLVPAIEARIRAAYLAAAGEAIPLHSGGLLTPTGRAVLVLGEPGTGKTTLLLRATTAGVSGLSDEIHRWDPVSGLVDAYPRAYAVKEGTFHSFPELARLRPEGRPSLWNGHRLWYVAPGRPAARRVPLAALVLLSREHRDVPLRPVPQWERLSALLPHAWGDGSALCGPAFAPVVHALARLPLWRGGADRVLEWFLGPAAAVAEPRDPAMAGTSPAESSSSLSRGVLV